MLIDKDIEAFPPSAKWGDKLLGSQFRDWLHRETTRDYDPYSDQEGHYTYEWWLENVQGL